MLDKDQIEFIKANLLEDPAKLALKGVDKFIISQISGRQKIKDKLPSFYNNPNLVLPNKLSLEQTSSEKTANYKASLVSGNTGIDLTGGFGIDTIAFAKRFEEFIYVEENTELFNIAKYNFDKLNLNNVKCINDNALNVINTIDKVDFIYADPARRLNDKKVISLQNSSPNLANIFSIIVEKSKNYIFKLSPMLDLSVIENELSKNVNFQAIKYQNEIKELLATNIGLKYTAVDLDSNKITQFKDNLASINFVNTGNFLYEPNPEVIKLNIADKIAESNNINKIANFTNYYLSNIYKAIPHFTSYKIIEFKDAKKSELKKLSNTNAIVKSKNYYLSPIQIRKKYKINEAKDKYLFFFKDKLGIGKYILAEKLEK